MKFIIDRPIKGSYSEEVMLELCGVAHRIIKETIQIIEVNTLEELYAITKDNQGKIVFGTNKGRENVDGWIEIYDDYRE